MAPDYTRGPVPQLQESDYNLRRRAAVGQTRASTERFKSSFYPNCLSEWEELEPEIKQSCSVNVFKKRLLAFIRPPSKKVYNIHDPKGLSILTQLRVGFSKLNFHKFKHNFSDTLSPLCPINDGIEDTEHFLLLYHAHDDDRRDLLNSVNAILRPHRSTNFTNENLLQTLLYVHEKLSFVLNRKILEATLNTFRPQNGFNRFVCLSPLSCNLFLRAFIFCDLLLSELSVICVYFLLIVICYFSYLNVILI